MNVVLSLPYIPPQARSEAPGLYNSRPMERLREIYREGRVFVGTPCIIAYKADIIHIYLIIN
jgi:hypothetical protein